MLPTLLGLVGLMLMSVSVVAESRRQVMIDQLVARGQAADAVVVDRRLGAGIKGLQLQRLRVEYTVDGNSHSAWLGQVTGDRAPDGGASLTVYVDSRNPGRIATVDGRFSEWAGLLAAQAGGGVGLGVFVLALAFAAVRASGRRRLRRLAVYGPLSIAAVPPEVVPRIVGGELTEVEWRSAHLAGRGLSRVAELVRTRLVGSPRFLAVPLQYAEVARILGWKSAQPPVQDDLEYFVVGSTQRDEDSDRRQA